MKAISILLSSASGLMVAFTLLCGLWLHSHGSTPEGASFHMKLAISTLVIVAGTIITLLVFVLKTR
jgi:hypothetical protein